MQVTREYLRADSWEYSQVGGTASLRTCFPRILGGFEYTSWALTRVTGGLVDLPTSNLVNSSSNIFPVYKIYIEAVGLLSVV